MVMVQHMHACGKTRQITYFKCTWLILIFLHLFIRGPHVCPGMHVEVKGQLNCPSNWTPRPVPSDLSTQLIAGQLCHNKAGQVFKHKKVRKHPGPQSESQAKPGLHGERLPLKINKMNAVQCSEKATGSNLVAFHWARK